MIKILGKFFNFVGKENKKKFQISLFFSVIEALSASMKIPAIMLVLSSILNHSLNDKTIILALSIMLIGLVFENIAKYKSTMLQTEGGFNGAAFKRIEIAEHLRYLPMGYFNEHSLGQITSVTTNTMEHLADIGTRAVMLSTSGLINTGIILAMVSIYDWRVGLVGIVGSLIFLFINSIMQKRSDKVSLDKIACDHELVSQVMEYLQGIAEIKNYNLVGKATQKLNTILNKVVKANIKTETTFSPFITIQNIACKLTGGMMIFTSIFLYLHNDISMLTCIGMCICSFMVFAILETAGTFSALLRMVETCVDKGQEILNIPSMDINGEDIVPQNYDIYIKNISFRYEKRKILDNVSLHIKEKTSLAVVGPSGGGKTTLCRLIARFWDVSSGEITLGGIDVRKYSMDSLMKNFSFVFQNVYLFADTVANNIRFGKEEATIDEVIVAAKKACCHDFIMKLPQGYNTIIGEGGASLSGGEKQRISIARAIMKDAPIIILDEATANVDPENEKELIEAINSLIVQKTVIMIAHRLKTVRKSSQIAVVDQQKIVQLGTHEQLMQEEGIYKRFVNSRKLAVDWKVK